MAETTAEKKHITIGVLAHVDAGKTTLSEELLYETGVRKQARDGAKPGHYDFFQAGRAFHR